MEKYSRWSDTRTGINPFVPVDRKLSANIFIRILHYVFGSVFALIRFVLFAVVLMVLGISSIISYVFYPIGIVHWYYRRITEYILCGILLLICGVYSKCTIEDGRRLALGAHTKKANSVGRKDIILANYQSFIDILYLARMYSPVFVFPGSKNMVKTTGLFGGLLQAFSLPDLNGGEKLTDVVRSSWTPLVVFPEGTRTNGKGILPFINVFEDIEKMPPVHLIGFKYEYQNVNPAHTVENGVLHLLRLLFHGIHHMQVFVLCCNRTPLFPGKDAAIRREKDAFGNRQAVNARQWVEKIENIFENILRTKRVPLTLQDYVEFKTYWHHVTQGGRKAASEFTSRAAPHEHAQWTKNRPSR